MSNIQIKTDVKITATIELTEGHLRALDALASYSTETFLQVFYKNIGTSSLRPYEKDLHDLFAMIRSDIPQALNGVKKAREELGRGIEK